jgi:hypothetical protein
VVVEVILGDIGEDGHEEGDIEKLLLMETLRGGFEDDVVDVGSRGIAEKSLEVGDGWDSEVEVIEFALAGDLDGGGGEKGGLEVGGFENFVEVVGGGGFAVGASDSDDLEASRGVTEASGNEVSTSSTISGLKFLDGVAGEGFSGGFDESGFDVHVSIIAARGEV